MNIGVVGVGRLRTRYGGLKNRGGKPYKRMKASGKMIRLITKKKKIESDFTKELKMKSKVET